MYGCYDAAVDLDDKMLEMEGAKKPILRWGLFLGTTLISLVIMVILLNIAVNQWGRTTGEIQFSFDRMVIFMIVLMLFLLVVGILFLFRGKLNAWLGVFFLLCTIYYLYLMISTYSLLTSGGDTTYSIGQQIALYIFDVILIIYTTATLIGTKTEVLSEKFKFIKPDGILMWLIFSKASYEFAVGGFSESMNVSALNAIVGIVLFTILFFIAGLYGIISYGKRKKKVERSKDIIESE
jgi:Ca2+/Na+ antiporter